MMRSPSLPYVAPFAVFLLLLALMPFLGLAPRVELLLWLVIVGATVLACSRSVLDLSVKRWAGSAALGAAVFGLWIAPDLLFPAYRESVLFRNPLMAGSGASFPLAARDDATALALRSARAVLLVPLVEELFWRAWLPRWIVAPDFRTVPLGAYTAGAFCATALLFALEHGSYWDVGLLAGVLYNGWMWRTRSLGDCVLAHAVTNGCLSAYVVAAGQWQYW
ncbi:MAG: CAAX prenyl protease-related protein [Burkholderiales bacterium]